MASYTPQKFNIAPEKWWLEDYFPIGKEAFKGRAVKLQGGTAFNENPFILCGPTGSEKMGHDEWVGPGKNPGDQHVNHREILHRWGTCPTWTSLNLTQKVKPRSCCSQKSPKCRRQGACFFCPNIIPVR